jgi:hypothetical protein
MIYDVIVIGGGASGMMAAGTAAKRGKAVLILEKNKKLGEKLKITGGGRCNITNADPDYQNFISNYGDGKDFLHSPFSQFGVQDTFKFFEKLGLPIVVQARHRAFPATESSIDVFNVMEKFIKENKVVIKTDHKVSKINFKDNTIISVIANGEEFIAKNYIFATGGLSHPETGSTGDGFKWLENIGHTTQAPTPTIVPISVPDEWVRNLAGVSLSFMKITFFSNGKKAFSKTGKVLFTHFGLSGPLILNSAVKIADLLHAGVVTATIDAYPDTNLGALDDKIVKIFDNNKNKDLKNIIDEIVPDGLGKEFLNLLGERMIMRDTKVHSITKDERKIIVNLLKALPMTVAGLMGYDRAVVADGGVDLREIDTKTMRSKKYDNLFVTGDLLDINRPSGGFSLQLCWTTGYVAGINI